MSGAQDRDRAVEKLLRRTLGAGRASSALDACPDSETLAAWLDGGLDDHERTMLVNHTAVCARCQAAVGVMARTSPALPAAVPFWKQWKAWLVPVTAAAAATTIWMVVPAQREAPQPSAVQSKVEAVEKREAGPVGNVAPAAESLEADRAGRRDQAAPPAAPSPARPRPSPEPLAADRFAEVVPPSAAKEQRGRSEAEAQSPAVPPSPRNAPAEAADVRLKDAEARQAGAVGGAASATAPPLAEAKREAPPAARADDADQRARERAAAQPAAAPPPPPAPRFEQAPAQPAPAQPASARPAPTQPAPAAPATAETAGQAAGVGPAGAEEIRLSKLGVARDAASPDRTVRFRWDRGGVQRSLDAGSTWESIPADRPADIVAGSAPARDVCWLAGRGGLVLRMVNGRRFERVQFPESVDLVAVQATGADTATVTTADGRRFRTGDGGRTWQR